jgi:hypothetical protein
MLGHGPEIGGLLGSCGRSACRSGALVRAAQILASRSGKRSLLDAAIGAGLIQADWLDSKSAAEVADSLADALEELRRLKRNLDRRTGRDQGSRAPSPLACSIWIDVAAETCHTWAALISGHLARP